MEKRQSSSRTFMFSRALTFVNMALSVLTQGIGW